MKVHRMGAGRRSVAVLVRLTLWIGMSRGIVRVHMDGLPLFFFLILFLFST